MARPGDAEARAALGLVYDGDFHGAEARLAALAQERPGDPVLPYLQALALEWRLEQDPASRAHDAEVLALADRAPRASPPTPRTAAPFSPGGRRTG